MGLSFKWVAVRYREIFTAHAYGFEIATSISLAELVA